MRVSCVDAVDPDHAHAHRHHLIIGSRIRSRLRILRCKVQAKIIRAKVQSGSMRPTLGLLGPGY